MTPKPEDTCSLLVSDNWGLKQTILIDISVLNLESLLMCFLFKMHIH